MLAFVVEIPLARSAFIWGWALGGASTTLFARVLPIAASTPPIALGYTLTAAR
jgi:hypothetical protein